MRLPRSTVLGVLAVAAIAAAAVALRSDQKATHVKKGTVVCGAAFDVSAVKPGDYVVIKLQSADKKFTETTWARVRSLSPIRDRLSVEIAGEFTDSGIRPINTKRHGFRLGESLIIESNCVLDVLSSEMKGQILCGPELGNVGLHAIDTKDLSIGDEAQIVIASNEAQGTAWHEPLWVSIMQVSPTQNVLKGKILDNPKSTALHGLSRHSRVDFVRDCVIDMR